MTNAVVGVLQGKLNELTGIAAPGHTHTAGDAFNPGNPGAGGSGSSSGGSGSSSGGSSSGGSSSSTPKKPPADQYVSDTFKQDAVARQKMSMFASLYARLWGEPATENYLMSAVKAGLNAFEFEARERGKPEFAQTKTYKTHAKSLADLLQGLGI